MIIIYDFSYIIRNRAYLFVNIILVNNYLLFYLTTVNIMKYKTFY